MATLKDVAQLAGVGLGTASRAISGSGPVSADARRRVQAAIVRLKFRPSSIGRSLSKQSLDKCPDIHCIIAFLIKNWLYRHSYTFWRLNHMGRSNNLLRVALSACDGFSKAPLIERVHDE